MLLISFKYRRLRASALGRSSGPFQLSGLALQCPLAASTDPQDGSFVAAAGRRPKTPEGVFEIISRRPLE